MPLRELQYPAEPYSRVNRLRDRGESQPITPNNTDVPLIPRSRLCPRNHPPDRELMPDPACLLPVARQPLPGCPTHDRPDGLL